MLDIQNGIVELQMGSGGRANDMLIKEVFLSSFPKNPLSYSCNDQAVFGGFEHGKIAFTTDSHIVKPLFFKGGDIGTLAVNGTVNDLAVGGAKPLYLSASFIIAEGFPLSDLKRIAESMGKAAEKAGVFIVTGDTKVVDKSSCDGVFINTAGVGFVPNGVDLSATKISEGDVVLVSGNLGQHETVIMAQREGMGFDVDLSSDCAALNILTADIMAAGGESVKCMRDLTRGGLAAALNEIVGAAGCSILLEEDKIPVLPKVKAVCQALGLDAFNLANEGKLVAFVKENAKDDVLAAMRAHPLGKDAEIIGRVILPDWQPEVIINTVGGGKRLLEWAYGDYLPRIC
jgi:hydrogenase expression/formation protein HypE